MQRLNSMMKMSGIVEKGSHWSQTVNADKVAQQQWTVAYGCWCSIAILAIAVTIDIVVEA